jgi:hypothetical protein
MIIMALVLVTLEENGYRVRTGPPELGMLFGGALLIFSSFVWDFAVMLAASGFSPGGQTFSQAVRSYVPGSFHWGVFLAGEILIAGFVVLSVHKARRLI